MDNDDAAHFADYVFCNSFQYPSGYSAKLEWPVSRRKALQVHINAKSSLKKLPSHLELLIVSLRKIDDSISRQDQLKAWSILQDQYSNNIDPLINAQMSILEKLVCQS